MKIIENEILSVGFDETGFDDPTTFDPLTVIDKKIDGMTGSEWATHVRERLQKRVWAYVPDTDVDSKFWYPGKTRCIMRFEDDTD